MLIVPAIAAIAESTFRLTWSGIAGKTVRVFLNGLLAFGPTVIATADKTVDLSFPDPCAIEVHENDSTETVPAASIAMQRKPLLWWSSVANAAEYRVYFDNLLLAVVPHEPSRLHHEHQVTQDVRQDGGSWIGFHVTAVTAGGRESEVVDRPFFAAGVPVAPSDVDVDGTGGTFDIEVSP